MIVPLRFEAAIAARTNGTISIALLASLPAPFERQSVCIAILECDDASARALCREIDNAMHPEGSKAQ